MELTPEVVSGIHHKGGTILGSSRGFGDKVDEIVDSLERMNTNILFTIGGDGTQKGALNISKEIAKRGLKIAVVGTLGPSCAKAEIIKTMIDRVNSVEWARFIEDYVVNPPQ